MAFTYTATAASDALKRIREAIGDTDSTAKQTLRLEDEVINQYLARLVNEAAATLKCAKVLLARFAREADMGTRSASLDATRRFERLRSLIAQLELDQSTAGGVGIGAPYLSKAAVDAYDADPNNVGTRMATGMLDADM